MYTWKMVCWDVSDTMKAYGLQSTYIRLFYYDLTVFVYIVIKELSTLPTLDLEALLLNGMASSFSAKGCLYLNAWIESFHAQLKKSRFIEELYEI